MASYLRPRRGKEATAKSQNIVLKRGEIFFETPAGGVGTGIGRLKMGDGSTSYASLPYFLMITIQSVHSQMLLQLQISQTIILILTTLLLEIV